MRIEKITYQHRRDFKADMICEGCGARAKLTSGYDDRYFHDEVIPNIKCEVCGKSRRDMGIVSEPTPTKYPEGYQI